MQTLDVRPGIYHHFKDVAKEYRVLGTALHTETEEPMVVYEPLYPSEFPLFVRPARMFLETVIKPEIEYQGPRFVWVREG